MTGGAIRSNLYSPKCLICLTGTEIIGGMMARFSIPSSSRCHQCWHRAGEAWQPLLMTEGRK